MGVKHWTEADYYTASRRARQAWERTDSQLVIGLEGGDGAGTTSLVASSPSSPPPVGRAACDLPPRGDAGSTPTEGAIE